MYFKICQTYFELCQTYFLPRENPFENRPGKADKKGRSLFARRVDTQEYEKKQGETPERRAAVAEKRQRNAYDGREPYDHAYVYEHVEQEYAEHAVAVYSSEGTCLPFGHVHQAQYQRKVEYEYE